MSFYPVSVNRNDIKRFIWSHFSLDLIPDKFLESFKILVTFRGVTEVHCKWLKWHKFIKKAEQWWLHSPSFAVLSKVSLNVCFAADRSEISPPSVPAASLKVIGLFLWHMSSRHILSDDLLFHCVSKTHWLIALRRT